MSSDFYFFQPLGAKENNLYIGDLTSIDAPLLKALAGNYYGIVIKCEVPSGLGFMVPFKERIRSLTLEVPCPDTDAIGQLLCLERLHVPKFAAGIRFKQLSRLEELELSDCRFPDEAMEAGGLKVLTLARVKGICLRTLAGFRNLTSLEVNVCDVRSLEGIETLGALRELYLAQLPLENLAGVEQQHGLEKIRLSYMQKLREIEALANLPRLDELMCVSCKKIEAIDGAISPQSLGGFFLIDGGNVQTLSGLEKNMQLDTLDFSGTTKVADGKVRFLANLPRLAELRFEDRRHYDATWRELQQTLKPRTRPPRGRFAFVAG